MKGLKVVGVIAFAVALSAVLAWFVSNHNVPILNPQGSIGEQQRDLIIIATLLMLIVVLPVFFLTGFIAWKYRASNTKAKYEPNRDGSKILESIWWGLPLTIILTLSILIWNSSHTLDPFKKLDSNEPALTIQVVALQWKWLFLYPEQGIATINYIQFPEDTPLNFEITADAPMNSFWIPSLGGQVYAMNGMQTKLHLIADEQGTYDGSSANISGEGFAGMRFKAKATSESDFGKWVSDTKQSTENLDDSVYHELAEPSKNVAPKYYGSYDSDLFNTIMMKYMAPGHQEGESHEYTH